MVSSLKEACSSVGRDTCAQVTVERNTGKGTVSHLQDSSQKVLKA